MGKQGTEWSASALSSAQPAFVETPAGAINLARQAGSVTLSSALGYHNHQTSADTWARPALTHPPVAPLLSTGTAIGAA